MTTSHRKGAFGSPQLEVCLAVVIAAVVLGALMERVDTALERAEKSAMELQLINLRSALRLEKARRMAAGQPLWAVEEMNPLPLLEIQGQVIGNPESLELSKMIKTSSWSFDDLNHTLHFLPQRRRHLKLVDGADASGLAWQIAPIAGQTGEPELRLLTPYRWF